MPTRKLALKGAGLKVDIEPTPQPQQVDIVPAGVGDKAILTIGSETFECAAEDLVDLCELGRGAYGVVNKTQHRLTGTIMAVKRIRATVDTEERKRLLMDLNVSMMAKSCPYTVTFYGALFREGDVLICMELMDKSLRQLYDLVYGTLHSSIPEPVIGIIALSVMKALHFLKFQLQVMHRDVKPSNILINRGGEIKLCDFGIAGDLVNSFCVTQIGCKPYLAPERINPPQDSKDTPAKYDERSDVWSFGITMYELALGKFPYPQSIWKNPFDQLKCVVHGDPPQVPSDAPFSDELKDFVRQCLSKKVSDRPKYSKLVEHPLILKAENIDFDIGQWYRDLCDSVQTQE
ncbi:dual specificity mitogen-activated protein kinase kinase 6-like [Halichondria panicea]|uniref:dual specificity mitogen-activated protein kinase kinase 6-like n=1 Tax=Halichondria panicea TaxID=6063 RepID=UPI00312BA122